MVIAPRLAEHPDVLLPGARLPGRLHDHPLGRAGRRCSTTRTSRAFVGEYRIPIALLDLAHADLAGPVRDARLLLRAAAPAGRARSQAALDVFDEVAASSSSSAGRRYGPLEPYGLDGAERAIVCLGSTAGTVKDVVDELRAEGEPSGCSRSARSGRSRPSASAALLARRRDVAVLDRADSPGGAPPLFAEVAAALCRHARRRPEPRLRARRPRPPPGGHPRRLRAATARPLRRPERRAVSRLKTLVRNEAGTPPLRGGHSLCQGCGIPMVVRTVLDSIETPVVVVSATGCLEVATTRFPTTAWNVPWLHVAFENAAAVASGVESAYRALAPPQAPAADEAESRSSSFAGDGGTYDIGLQALSGALERGHRFVFVCYDNEAYMNTGVQRSGATPFGASTTTSPAGDASLGKAQQRKDMTAIAVAHHVPYVAQAAAVALARPEREGRARRRAPTARRSSTC